MPILLPIPQKYLAISGYFLISSVDSLFIQGMLALEGYPIAKRLQQALFETQKHHVSIHVGEVSGEMKGIFLKKTKPYRIVPQGYQLEINPNCIMLEAQDVTGLFYGVMTLIQLLRQSNGALDCCEINDFPDFQNRGVLLDVSRHKVPKMETLKRLIDEFSEWKINQIQLYTEHTFAYRQHPLAWEGTDPLTGTDILELDSYCRERFIELVPNQNSFGHLNPWLKLPAYQHLAECPDGFTWPWGTPHLGPFSLDPSNPESLTWLKGLYQELLPYFSSKKFNVGCDETLDLGQGRNQERCQKEGVATVYLEFIKKIHTLVKSSGHHMQCWADIVLNHPEVLPELPEDLTLLLWGYEADHPFEDQCQKIEASGRPFYVCPGTSAWCSLAGRTTNTLGNLRSAAHAGKRYGANGLLITDWGDHGHWQHLPVSYLGFAAGAAFSWNTEGTSEESIPSMLDYHVFHDENQRIGRLIYDLGNLYLDAGQTPKNGSLFFHLIAKSTFQFLKPEVTVERLQQCKKQLGSLAFDLSQIHLNRSDMPWIQAEFSNTAAFMDYACDRAIAFLQGSEAFIPQSQLRFEALCDDYALLWLQRNRPGGLTRSLELLWRHRNPDQASDTIVFC